MSSAHSTKTLTLTGHDGVPGDFLGAREKGGSQADAERALVHMGN